jgi:hypothetical protein
MSGEALRGWSLRYDRLEDRMALTLRGADEGRCFWITRRQCTGLVTGLSPAARRAAAEAPLPRGKGSGAARETAEGAAAPAAILAVISMRRTSAAVRLVFKAPDQPDVAFTCGATEFEKLQGSLYRIAQAAGWVLDVPQAEQAVRPQRPVSRQLH